MKNAIFTVIPGQSWEEKTSGKQLAWQGQGLSHALQGAMSRLVTMAVGNLNNSQNNYKKKVS